MDNQVTVEISARHVHLSQADLETLFGKGYALTVKKMLSQPCLLYTSPSPRDRSVSRMPSSA